MLESPGRGGMAFLSNALEPELIIFCLRLRSAILETSKSRGLNSEDQRQNERRCPNAQLHKRAAPA